jgi:hypothetical protein
MSYVQTYSSGNTGITLVPTDTERITTPKGLLVTRAIQMKNGWVGQIIIDKTIVWEGTPEEDERDATQQATQRVVERLMAIFSDDADLGPVD